MSKIVIISGSPTVSSRLNGILEYAQSILEQSGAYVERLQVRDLPPADLVYARFDSPEVLKSIDKVEQADAVLIATPVYKAAYTGLLKTFLDLLPQKALVRKTILPVAIGGTIAHLLSIDYSLKPVLSALGATRLQSGVYIVDSQVLRDDRGHLTIEEEALKRLHDSLVAFLEEIESTRERV
ncbi:NADPH-dependent FMN reductase [Paenibacillus mesophilus]|uniref:NADPH-dependent FMN reductase n=1 Tax=Paenibacillus mesophilus TaxID=2582849 RepID=UPI00110E9DF2|nr:NADPH-dependent FMN reductase [Paenibacillus mesophilus]TMV48390.1 NADPH-dependent FMN reductase [Paenibacillus mesophilus]